MDPSLGAGPRVCNHALELSPFESPAFQWSVAAL
jgi:hypothetical protein